MRHLTWILTAVLLAAPVAGQDKPKPVTLPDKPIDADPSKAVKFTFAAAGDVVWLKVRADKKSQLHVGLGLMGGKATMALFDAKGLPVRGKQTEAGDRPSWQGTVPPGDYYLRVTCEAPGQGQAFAFVMLLPEIEIIKPPDIEKFTPGPVLQPARGEAGIGEDYLLPAELQPRPLTAKLPDKAIDVTLGKSMQHTFRNRDELLWLKVRVKQKGYLLYDSQVDRARVGGVELFNDKGACVSPDRWTTTYRGGQSWAAAAEAGTYWLRLKCDRPDTKPVTFTFTAEPLDPGEPDDTLQTARTISLGKAIPLRICPARDVDHLRFEVKQAGTIVVRPLKGGKPWTPRLILVDPFGKVAAGTKGAGYTRDTDDREWWAARVWPGTYTLSVSGYRASLEMTELTVELLSAEKTDLFEPNDRPECARAVPLGWNIPLRLLPAKEEDWFRLTMPDDGVLTLRHLTGKLPSPNFLLREATSDKPIDVGSFRIQGKERWWATRVGKGDYLVRVTGWPSLGEQIVRFDFETEADLYEPNDDAGHAAATLGAVHIRTFPPSDRDWFLVKADTPGILTVTVPPGDVKTSYQGAILSPGDEKPRKVRFDYAEPRPGRKTRDWVASVNVQPGTHKIQLWDARAARQLHAVHIELTPQDDPYEPNDTRQQARAVTVGQSVGIRLDGEDEDWFVFDAPADGFAVFHFTGKGVPVHIVDPETGKLKRVQWPSVGMSQPGSFHRVLPIKKGRFEFVLKHSGAEVLNRLLEFEFDFLPLGGKEDTNLFIVAFQTNEGGSAEVGAIAASGGGRALATTRPEDLPEILKGTVHAAETRRIETQPPEVAASAPAPASRKGSSAWALWIGTAIAAIVAGVVVLALVRRKRGNETA